MRLLLGPFAVDMAPKQKIKQLAETLRAQKAAEAEPPQVEEDTPPPPPPNKKQKKGKVGEDQEKNEGAEEKPKSKKGAKPKTQDDGSEEEKPEKPKEKSRAKPKKQVEGDTAEEAAPKKRRVNDTAPKAKAKSKAAKDDAEIAVPDFEITWANHSKLMKFYGISEADATACLLELVGEDESGRSFWEKFKTPAVEVQNPRRGMTRKEREQIQESQLSDSPDTELDGQSMGSGTGSTLDNMETQPPEHEEVTKHGTGLSEKNIKKIVAEQATPAKKVGVGCFETSVCAHMYTYVCTIF